MTVISEMKIEVGKTCKSRSGCKVEIYAYKPDQKYCWVGAIFSRDKWSPESWTTNGTFNLMDGNGGYDITSEWVEPVKFECNVEWKNFSNGVVAPCSNEMCWSAVIGKKGKLTFVENIDDNNS